MSLRYFDRLSDRVNRLGALCVGIDPHDGVLDAWGLNYDCAGLESVAMGTVEALIDQVAVFKPQSAFFERWGSPGIAVLEKCIDAIHQGGGLVILDVKRGDIGSTMGAYAQAYLSDGPLSVDAITVSPYLGFGSLLPAIELAEANGRGVYVLARTSNPEGGEVQFADAQGTSVAQSIVDQAGARNTSTESNAVGLVIGGTHDSLGVDISAYCGSILVPGIGAQGGTISGVEALFSTTDAVIVPSVSREVLYSGSTARGLQEAVARVLTT